MRLPGTDTLGVLSEMPQDGFDELIVGRNCHTPPHRRVVEISIDPRRVDLLLTVKGHESINLVSIMAARSPGMGYGRRLNS